VASDEHGLLFDITDCEMTVHTHEATCYIMGECCRRITAEERAKIDSEILRIYRQAVLRKEAAERGVEMNSS